MLGSFRVLRSSLRQQRGALAIAIATAVGAQAVGLPLPLLTRWLVNSASGRSRGTSLSVESLLWIGAAVLVLLALLRGGCRWLQEVYGERVAQTVLVDIRSRMYRQLQRLSQGYFDRNAVGKLVVRYIGDAGALRTWLARTIIAAPADLLTLMAIAAAVGILHAELLIAATAPLVLLVVALLLLNPSVRRWTRQARGKQSRLCGGLGKRIAAMGAIKAANAQDRDHAEVLDELSAIAADNVRRGRVEAWSRALSVGATTVALGSVGLWGASLYLQGVVNHGDLLAAIWLTVLTRGPVHRLAHANTIHQRARASVHRIEKLLSRQPESGWSPQLASYEGPGRTVEVDDLGYKDAAGRWALRHLSATLRGPGLVGVSSEVARAKSFFLQLLLRLRRPHEGRIRLDGKDVRELRVDDVRRQMGWVDRERCILDLDDVTRAAAPDAGDHRGVAEEVRMHSAVRTALRLDPPILLLDEPTQGLEDDAVERLVGWLKEAARSRLIVVATNDARILRLSGQTITLPAERRLEKTAAADPPAQGDSHESNLRLAVEPRHDRCRHTAGS